MEINVTRMSLELVSFLRAHPCFVVLKEAQKTTTIYLVIVGRSRKKATHTHTNTSKGVSLFRAGTNPKLWSNFEIL